MIPSGRDPGGAPDFGASAVENPFETPRELVEDAAGAVGSTFDDEPARGRVFWPLVVGRAILFFFARIQFFAFVWVLATLLFIGGLCYSNFADQLDVFSGNARDAVIFSGLWAYWLLASPFWLFLRKLAVRLATTGTLTRAPDERAFFSREYLGRGMFFQAAQSLLTVATPLFALVGVWGVDKLSDVKNVFGGLNPEELFGVVFLIVSLWFVAISSRMITATFFLTERGTAAQAWRWARSHSRGLARHFCICEIAFRLFIGVVG
ncbi:MAG: hypothetical protein HUK22_07435, partial [Thermoguttaceae bacterium]|nr:hypothetical protein [Thermoguttaceae bacterium]